ncbi:MAG: transporter substrate-binding domain-containing protein, partial [Gammaproteobacteria bacterium]|nr:transporter substrate-binding domain-containing protein [Gammaproteobacteria bacterium]
MNKNNRLFYSLSLLFLMWCISLPLSAAPDPRPHLSQDEIAFLAEHPVIRVHNEKDWPPFNYHEGALPKGYSIDYMNLLADRLGIKVEYVTGPSWNEFLQMLKRKELDVMLNIINTEQRREYALFTNSYLKPFAAIYTRDDDQEVHTLDDLKGDTVAVPKGFFTEELLRSYYPEINVYTTKGIHGSLLAVMEGHARATLGELAVVNYLIKKYRTPGIKAAARIRDKRFINSLNIGVRDDWSLLRDLLQKAMESITDDEILKLRGEWFGEASPKLELTGLEQEFLKERSQLNVAINPKQPPFSYFESGIAKGFSVEYARLLGAQLGLKLNFIWKRSGIDQNARADLVLDQDFSQKSRDGYALFDPYARSVPALFSKTDHYYTRLDELKGKRLAVVGGRGYDGLLRLHYPDLKILPVDNIEAAIDAVIFGKADAFMADYNEATYQLQTNGIVSIKALSSLKDSRFFSDLSFAVPKSKTVLQSIVRKGLERVEKTEVQLLKERWLRQDDSSDGQISLTTWEREYLQNNNRFTFCADPDWHPFDFIDSESRLPSGMAIDTLALIEEKIGHSIKFDWRPSGGWAETIKSFKKGDCDLTPAIVRTIPREQYALFTNPYMNYQAVIITRDDEPFIHKFEEIMEKGIARQKGSGMINLLRNRYEGVQIVETDSTLDSFQKVASGEVYATVAILPAASYYITRYGLSNLKIAGFTEIEYPVSIAVRKDHQELFSMVEKALASISDQQHRDIFNRWVSIKVDQQLDYTLYWRTLGAVLLLSMFFLYRHYQLTRYNRMLAKLSVTDKLTGLFNRSRLDAVLQEHYELFRRYDTPCCVIIFDADHFKEINDQYGHLVGDQVLSGMAKQFDQLRRVTDVLGRWGGEEFLLVCPNTEIEGARKVSEQIQHHIAGYAFVSGISMTVSIGVTQIIAGDAIETLLQRADDALYQAKSSGRN